MSKKFIFSSAEDDMLIEIIEKNRVIFDSSDPKHKDLNYKDSIWEDIGEKLNRNVDDCKKRWKNIRDTYMRKKRKMPNRSAVSDKKKWALMDYLSFLDTVQYDRNISTNVESEETEKQNTHITKWVDEDRDEDKDEDTQDETDNTPDFPVLSFKRKRLQRSKEDKMSATLAKRSKEQNELLSNIKAQNHLLISQLNQQEDDVDVFFKSIAMSLKKCPSQAINEAKHLILTVVTQMEDKYLGPNNSH